VLLLSQLVTWFSPARFPKLVPKCPTPTGPQHSPVARPKPLQAFFHVSMNFWNVSLVVTTFSFTWVSCCKISSVVSTIMRVFNFSAFSCVAYFTMACAAASSSVTQNASSCNVSRSFCAWACCYVLIWFMSKYNFLFSMIATIFFVGVRVLIVSLNFCHLLQCDLQLLPYSLQLCIFC
jgi:hypothetical protein